MVIITSDEEIKKAKAWVKREKKQLKGIKKLSCHDDRCTNTFHQQMHLAYENRTAFLKMVEENIELKGIINRLMAEALK